MKRSTLFTLIVAGLALGPTSGRMAHAQDTVEPPPPGPPSTTSSLRDTLRGVTQDSGNSGSVISSLTSRRSRSRRHLWGPPRPGSSIDTKMTKALIGSS